MITLQKLLGKYYPGLVVDRLAELYPDEVDNKDKYLAQYRKCLHLDTVTTDLIIVVREYPGDSPSDITIDVGAITGETRRQYYLRDNPGKEVPYPENPSWDELESFSLGLTAWNEWVAMPIHQESLDKYPEIDLIAHCLWEMSWHSFDETKTQDVLDRIKETIMEIDSGSGKLKLTSFEDFFKGLPGPLGDD